MADYESDSSGETSVATNVLLGYASREPTVDAFSRLGGHPTWLDETSTPSGNLATCKICNSLMCLLLQLNSDLPERYPVSERRLYLWSCRRKACRRKEGSIRGFRATKASILLPTNTQAQAGASPIAPASQVQQPAVNLGETLFGVKTAAGVQANPFSSASSASAASNPFAESSSTSSAIQASPANGTLHETFAQKARISSPTPTQPKNAAASQPWPDISAFPPPFPSYHIDAETEYLEPEDQAIPSNARLDRGTMDGEGSNSAADMKDAFESSMDKTFQRFADRLAQNPEQVLRYEFDGQPLLYSKTDAVGRLLSTTSPAGNSKVKTASGANGSTTASRVPRCTNCGAARVFEMQLTPHAITELEAEDMSLDGMDWGTILMYVCSRNCADESIATSNAVSYFEEWVGVQWE